MASPDDGGKDTGFSVVFDPRILVQTSFIASIINEFRGCIIRSKFVTFGQLCIRVNNIEKRAIFCCE